MKKLMHKVIDKIKASTNAKINFINVQIYGKQEMQSFFENYFHLY